MLAFRNATIITPDETIASGTVLTHNGRIMAVGPNKAIDLPSNAEVIDATGKIVAPGYIDLQVNGGFGLDFTTDPESVWEVAAKLPRYGVTSFLPTIITAPLTVTEKAQEVVRHGRPQDFQGADPLGLHIEGPFLNPIKKGAHNPQHLRRPSLKETAGWSSGNGVKLVTLAPELPDALDLIRTLVSRGVVVSAGHSMATLEEAQAAFDAGARYATHLFNAMGGIHHREPGLPAAALADRRVTIGLIPDGLHVDPTLIKLVWQLTGSGRLNLVTDAMAALGMPPGHYALGDFNVTVDESSARLEDGTLAGCVMAMDEMVRNLVQFTGCPVNEAIATVTSTPADLLSMGDHKGRIAVGADADLTLLNPELKVLQTYSVGQLVFDRVDKPAGKHLI